MIPYSVSETSSSFPSSPNINNQLQRNSNFNLNQSHYSVSPNVDHVPQTQTYLTYDIQPTKLNNKKGSIIDQLIFLSDQFYKLFITKETATQYYNDIPIKNNRSITGSPISFTSSSQTQNLNKKTYIYDKDNETNSNSVYNDADLNEQRNSEKIDIVYSDLKPMKEELKNASIRKKEMQQRKFALKAASYVANDIRKMIKINEDSTEEEVKNFLISRQFSDK